MSAEANAGATMDDPKSRADDTQTPPGRWMQRGMIRVWVGPPIVDDDDYVPPEKTRSRRRVSLRTGLCEDCGVGIERRSVRCWDCHVARGEATRIRADRQSPESAIADVLERLGRNLYPRRTLGETCHCGCLITAGESCPSCLVWAMRDEAIWSWAVAVEHYSPSNREAKVAA